jgi:hypothetical protein
VGAREIIELLKNVDRRLIYALMFLAVGIPLLFPVGWPILPGADARNIYDTIESLPAGSIVMMSFDYDPGSRAEVHPMAKALLHHLFKKKHKLIAPALWPQGASLAATLTDEMVKPYGLKYGEDYVLLGYFAGPTNGLTQVTAIMGNLAAAYPTDTRGTRLSDLALTRRVTAAKDIALVFTLSAGDPGIPAWVQIANGRFGARLGGGATAVQTPQFLPYVQAGQMIGLLGGLRGAAEYEALVDMKGLATSGMDAQAFAHLLILVFILIANATYLYERWESRRAVIS